MDHTVGRVRLEGLIRDGVVNDQAELARLGHVSRARLTQIMDLLGLAPDVQEAVLFMPTVDRGGQAIMEKESRGVCCHRCVYCGQLHR